VIILPKSVIFVKNMTTNEKIEYWISLSDNDLTVASDLFKLKHFLYAGFMCHQSIEKIFKAFFVKSNPEINVPYIHNFEVIAVRGGFYDLLTDEQKDFIVELLPLNIEARYPEYKGKVSKFMTDSKTKEILDKTINLQQWMKKRLL
jgi:HEPN domain-containing protein